MRLIAPVLLLLLLAIGIDARESIAQTPSQQVCSTFIQEAIRTVGDNCGLLDRNSACYGYQAVSASFTEAQANDFFSQPNQRSPIRILSSISTSPLRTALDQWGIALLSVQANLPETLPGQSVIFMLLGDTEVENDVEEPDVYQPGEIISVTTARADSLIYLPRPNADVLASVPAGTLLQADAISSDGRYVRVVHQGVPGWVTVASLAGGVDLTPLAVITPDTRTPGQAFYLRTNIGQTECVQAPDSLLVQGPQNIQIDLRANNADIRIGSTVVLRVIPVIPRLVDLARRQFNITEQVFALLEMTVLDGKGIVDPDTDREQTVLPGQRIYRCLGAADNIALDGVSNDNPAIDSCPWFGLETLTREQIAEFAGLEGIELNYPVTLPEVPDPTPTPIPTNTPGVPGVFFPTNTPRPLPTNTPSIPLATNTPLPPVTPVEPTTTYVPPTNPPTATFTPTSTPLTCPTTIPGVVSTISELICAIDLANSTPGTDEITLAAMIWTFLTQHNPGNALPVITDSLIINGSGSTFTTSTASDPMRFFETASGVELTINALNLNRGTASSPGGAILSRGVLNVNDAIFTNNRSPDGNGGAIWHSNGGSLTLIRTLFSSNFASGAGAGVYSEGLTTIENSFFASNLAGEGAGLYICGVANISGSTFLSNNNHAVKGCTDSSIRMVNSTVSNNTNGVISDGFVTLSFVTVYGNDGVGFSPADGVLKNSIIAANDANCLGTFSSEGINFSAVNVPCPGTLFVPLADLQFLSAVPTNNGGNTPTHALGTGSVALNTVEDCTDASGKAAAQDQRGFVRPAPAGSLCDAGSFEEQLFAGATPTNTHTPTHTATHTPTFTPTFTPTHTPTNTPTFTPTFTPTNTPPSSLCAASIPNPAATVEELICAIELANDEINFPGPNTINLALDTFYQFLVPYSFSSRTALPDITSTITINGNLSVLSPGSGLDLRLFVITSTGNLTLNQMNITGWHSTEAGGAILSRGALNINATVLAGNQSASIDSGGAIYVDAGTLNITNSSLNNNSTVGAGGAIALKAGSGTATISGTSFTSNNANRGGAIFADTGGALNITLSRFVSNSAIEGGSVHTRRMTTINNAVFEGGSAELGGTHIYVQAGTTTVNTSTLSDSPSAPVIFIANTGEMHLLNSTVSSNSGGADVYGRLDILFSTIAFNSDFATRRDPDGIITLRHSLMVANGTANCVGGLSTATGVNYATDSTCGAGVTVDSVANIALGALANNGGVNRTHYPADSSIILGTIDPADCTDGTNPVTSDQRGVGRPAGPNCDPGAVENDTASGGGLGAPDLHAIPVEQPEIESLEPGDIEVLPEPELTPEATIDPESTPEATTDPESTPEIIMPTDDAPIAVTLPAPATIAPAATETPQGGEGLGGNFVTPTPTASPTFAPTPVSTLEAAARALDFTAWVIRR
jgi:hypothetical protein